MNLYSKAVLKKNEERPPVWFMRQAGRYHRHYQKIRAQHSFMDLCKKPELACEVTLGPIQDFGFDSAILFSDLLFPLEVMGMGLQYKEGPQLDWHLRESSDLERLQGGVQLLHGLDFQAKALQLIRKRLTAEKDLLGFVGGPLTLFCYAVEGSHQGKLDSARAGLEDGRFEGFFERLVDLLVGNMVLQAEAGANAIAVLDTCAGEFEETVFKKRVVPTLQIVMERFKEKKPETLLVYYSKKTGPAHWEHLKGVPFECLGIDWNHNLPHVLSKWGKIWSIQGNVDPSWLFLDPKDLERRLRAYFMSVKELGQTGYEGWICGLGHGVLPKTPEENVRLFLNLQKEIFSGNSQ